MMTTKALPDQELLRKTACPGFIFVFSSPGKVLGFGVNRYVECNSIADRTLLIQARTSRRHQIRNDLQAVSMWNGGESSRQSSCAT